MNTAADIRQAKLEEFVGQALDLNIHYDTDMDAYVIPRIAQFEEARDLPLGTFTKPSEWKEQRAFNQDLARRVASGPRGTWAIVVTNCHDGRIFYSTLISDGTGEISTGGSHDSYDTPPDYPKIYERMIGYEIYLARRVVEAQRQLARDQTAIRDHRLQAGMTFKDLMVDHKKFSTAAIQQVDPNTGRVKLFMTKRGSAQRYQGEVSASSLVERAGLSKREDLLSAA
ncbi:hypothetical protein [Microvirga tunisiensis]|uniref:Uncharacterized protein n=1 Tax=Microvirga tunisiensis TaxID=2108360 RepID=A0A5N7MB16_9HYPH|nr:hypothetical protein [Microvirga tunisiensis]MPR06317.1 hypothetical protein [Microvirga tunisiensis]MPR24103.1 hypothetical protein [Microvirga tunisiensis]